MQSKKIEYKPRERLDLTGLTLNAIYTNGYQKEITEGYETSLANGTILRKLGTQTITVTYEGKSVSFNIKVVPNPIPKLLINSSELLPDGMFIKNVPLKMTVNDLKENFNENYEISVDTKSAQYVGTGSILTVISGEKVIGKYELVVLGDVNGDGIATILDIFEINSVRLNAKTLQGAQSEAADLNKDGKINLFDIFAINKMRFKS